MDRDADVIAAQKTALRDQLVTTRGRRSLLEVNQDARALADVLWATDAVRRAATVAAYVSVGKEPGTGPLIELLRGQGRRVILPVVRPDRQLDWAPYTGPDGLVSGPLGLLEPSTLPLGPEAIATADVVLVPGLAVDRTGARLGKGGGYYDRALGLVPVGTFTCILLYDGEVLDSVPADVHDRPVTAVATPSGLLTLPTARA